MKLNELTESIDSTMAKLAAEYTGGDFKCTYNKLTSLEHCPTEVNGGFSCTRNELTSLEYCPKEITSDFYCYDNKLTSLEHCPTKIKGDFYCYNNKLTSLEHGPTEVTGDFNCDGNELTSLEHCPKEVYGEFYCHRTKITSLVGIHKHLKLCEEFYFDSKKIVEGGLGLLLIKNLTWISSSTEPFKIIKKYLGQGVKGLPKCQQELIDAGYNEYAKL